MKEIAKLLELMKRIKEKGRKGIFEGTDKCPNCGSALIWSVAPSNLHTRGSCKGENGECGFSWIE